jgi:hypothetical protein
MVIYFQEGEIFMNLFTRLNGQYNVILVAFCDVICPLNPHNIKC